MTPLKNIKAIIHDWDDTITNSFETYSSWYNVFAEYYSLNDPDMQVVRANWGKTVPHLVNAVWPDVTIEEADKMTSEFGATPIFKKHNFLPVPFTGITDTFKVILRRKQILGIISSANKSQLERSYKTYIDKDLSYHHFIFTKEDQIHHKPDPRVFNSSLKILNGDGLQIPKDQMIYVGDHLLDYQAAQGCGIAFVAVTTGITSKEAFLEAGVVEAFILASFNDILDVLG